MQVIARGTKGIKGQLKFDFCERNIILVSTRNNDLVRAHLLSVTRHKIVTSVETS